MEYDELIECLRHHCGHVSLAICTSEREQAADAITKLRAERDALRALLNEAQGFIQPDTGWDYTTDAGGYLYDRIERALAGEKNNGAS